MKNKTDRDKLRPRRKGYQLASPTLTLGSAGNVCKDSSSKACNAIGSILNHAIGNLEQEDCETCKAKAAHPSLLSP